MNRAQLARKLQGFYRANKKKCTRKLMDEQSPPCKIDAEKLEEFFTTQKQPLGDVSPDWLSAPKEQDAEDELMYVTKSASSCDASHGALARVRMEWGTGYGSPWSSSPGPDGVGYRVWKSMEL